MFRHTWTAWVSALLWSCQAEPPERFNVFPVGGITDGDAFCTALGEARCARWSRCLPARAAALQAAGGCAAAAARTCREEHAAALAAVAVGRAAVMPNAAASCVEGWRSGGCADPLPHSCARAIIGVVTAWEPCTSHVECAPGLYCGGGVAACGLCLARGRTGEPCLEHAECEDGLRCAAAQCLAALPEGAACTADPSRCDDGLTCAAGRCARPAGEGGPCGAGGCAEGLVCSGAVCVLPATEGADCAEHPCALDGSWLWCAPSDHRCAVVEVVAAGMSCAAGRVCAEDAVCMGGSCQPRPGPGDTCTDDCFRSTCRAGRCVVDVAPGDACGAGCGALDCVQGECGRAPCADGGVGTRGGWPVTRDGGVDGGGP